MKSWKFYDDNAKRLFDEYMSLDFNEIFSDVSQFFIDSDIKILDVGAGSGRDSAALSQKGYNVTAVEPSDNMREFASEYHKNLNIEWIKDYLPELKEINRSLKKYDLIIVSAVWMHLNKNEQKKSLLTLSKLLSADGIIIITLRLGAAEPDREIREIHTEDLIDISKEIGLTIEYISPVNADSFNRPSVTWQKVVLSKKLMNQQISITKPITG